MAGVEARALTDEEVLDRLGAAADDEAGGRLVHSDTEEDLKEFFANLRSGRE